MKNDMKLEDLTYEELKELELELAGFPMQKGDQLQHGKTTSMFDGYGMVFSGHYHTRSEKGNIAYTGIPYEITWADYADPKGFTVYDTNTAKYEFVRNELTIFEKLYYNKTSTADLTKLTGKIVKIIVIDKGDPITYERWLDSVRLVNPYELKIIENEILNFDGELDDTLEISDTPSLIKTYIDQIETSIDKTELNSYMQNLYKEALTVDDTI